MRGDSDKEENGARELKQEAKGDEDIRKLLFLDIMKVQMNSATPQLTDFSPSHGVSISTIEKASSSRKRTRKEVETNNNKERDRREKMSELYSSLQSMVPTLFFIKSTREQIINDATEYIKHLEDETRRLEDMKKSLLPKLVSSQGNSSSYSVNVSGLCNGVVFLGIQFSIRKGLVTRVLSVFERHGTEVLAANVSVDDKGKLMMVSVTLDVSGKGIGVIEKIKEDILNL